MLTVVYCALGVLFGVGFSCALRLFRRAVGAVSRPDGYALFLIAVTAGYGLFATIEVTHYASGGRVWAILSPLGLLLLGFPLLALRRRPSSGALVLALLGLSFCAVGATLMAGQWRDVPRTAMQIKLGLSLGLIPVACLVGLLTVSRLQSVYVPRPARVAF
ncbi:MAG: hypothetical protein KAY32_18205 [Candidatus Eisenbacteria sp.]|nr:hypothetical protein [Candidatus Eisenbacteria bacterium]